MAQRTYKIRGHNGLLMHNGRLADPTDPVTKFLKSVTSAKKAKNKTDADFEKEARLEFEAASYLDERGRPFIPGIMLEACIQAGAKKTSDGKTAKASIVVENDFLLEYDGPTGAEALYQKGFYLRTMVKTGMSGRVPCTRPFFKDWTLTFTLEFDETMVNAAKVDAWVEAAGKTAGIGAWRPRHGRFTVERVS